MFFGYPRVLSIIKRLYILTNEHSDGKNGHWLSDERIDRDNDAEDDKNGDKGNA